MLACLSLHERERRKKNEHIRIETSAYDTTETDTARNSIRGNVSLNDMLAAPNAVVLTGIAQHRLVTVYKIIEQKNRVYDDSYGSGSYDESSESERYGHFMPGIDLIYGYNLLNIAHYDLSTEKMNYLFDHPVLVKSLYYPSFYQDSLDKKPVNRDYYLVSVYDADTNADTLINKADLRRFYHFNVSGSEKLQIIPPNYSVVRSQYDPRNDVMYIFARHDENNSGVIDKKEPLHVFWLSLKNPEKAKRLY